MDKITPGDIPQLKYMRIPDCAEQFPQVRIWVQTDPKDGMAYLILTSKTSAERSECQRPEEPGEEKRPGLTQLEEAIRSMEALGWELESLTSRQDQAETAQMLRPEAEDEQHKLLDEKQRRRQMLANTKSRRSRGPRRGRS